MVFKSKGATKDGLLKVNGTSHDEQEVAVFNPPSKVYFLKVSTHFTGPVRIMGHQLTLQSRKYSFIINKKIQKLSWTYMYIHSDRVSLT